MHSARLELPPRPQAIADWVPAGGRLADVGTDHGYLPAALLLTGKIRSAIAADLGSQPLDRARQTAERWGVTMDLRRCDGLEAVSPEEADTVVIAGMGGETILHILENAPWTRSGTLLLLQPMSLAEALRPWLAAHGYRIRRERLVLDRGTIYPVIEAAGGAMEAPGPGLACCGYAGEADPLFAAYLAQWIRRTRRALEGMDRSGQDALQPKRLDLARRLRELEERSGGRP